MGVFRLALFLLFIGGAGAQVQIEPKNVAVLRGSSAQFNCSTAQTQSIMTWSLNGILVVNIVPNNWTASNPRFSATDYTTPGSYKWQFNIINVERGDAGQVTCQVMGAQALASNLSVQERGTVTITGGNQIVTQGVQTDFQCQADGWYPEPNVSWSVNGVVVKNCTNSSVAQGNVFNTSCMLAVTATKNSSVLCLVKVPAMSSPDNSTVFLTVGLPKARDQTILIAVTVAFSAAALLFLIIFGIIFFCKRRKKEKSGYQEELRRARVQSQHRTPVTTDARGRDNRGYVTDGRYGADYNGGVWHTNYSPKQQTSYPRDDFFDGGHRNHRHMTTV